MKTIMNIELTVKKLIKEGKHVEFTAPVKQVGKHNYYHLPDEELEKIISAYPEYERVGIELEKINGKKVWLPYYLSKGFFTTQENLLLPIKVIPIFPVDISNESLEDAAKDYNNNERSYLDDSFKDGANWQLQKDKAIIDKIFQALKMATELLEEDNNYPHSIKELKNLINHFKNESK